MQRLMEVVCTDCGIGLGPQLLDEHITMRTMTRRERQQLHDCLRLTQPPRRHGDIALDTHREPAQEPNPHGPARRSPMHAHRWPREGNHDTPEAL